ncbi:hypothetical protein ACOSQ2_003490 [Xanthoceras sorbifolium]
MNKLIEWLEEASGKIFKENFKLKKENLKLKERMNSLGEEKNDDPSYTNELREITASRSEENGDKKIVISVMSIEAKMKEEKVCLAQK